MPKFNVMRIIQVNVGRLATHFSYHAFTAIHYMDSGRNKFRGT
jgi:hypothetical protein